MRTNSKLTTNKRKCQQSSLGKAPHNLVINGKKNIQENIVSMKLLARFKYIFSILETTSFKSREKALKSMMVSEDPSPSCAWGEQ